MRIHDWLAPLARARSDQVVVTTMSAVRPWGHVSSHPLDFASADSAMGHAADLALGIALARPDLGVLCLNGDGSLLMTLGSLTTIVGAGATNLVLFVVDNGGFEITGNQPLAARGVDYVGMARAAGFNTALRFDRVAPFADALPDLLGAAGPTLVQMVTEPGDEGPIRRGVGADLPYLEPSLADSAARLRAALGPPARERPSSRASPEGA